MGGPRSKATPEEISAAFLTEEPFKATAARIGMSPNTLRKRWKAEFGEEAFKARGKRLQAKAAAKQARAMVGSRVFREVSVTCSKCGEEVTLKSNQVAQMEVSTFVCDTCKGEKYDRKCPACGQPVSGSRGLSSHMRHLRDAGDEVHLRYEREQEEAKWASQVEGVDYVTCLECGHRAASLARHLKAAHGITADDYRAKHGSDVLIRPSKVTARRSEAIKGRRGGFGKGAKKNTVCPTCGAVWEGSKFHSPTSFRALWASCCVCLYYPLGGKEMSLCLRNCPGGG